MRIISITGKNECFPLYSTTITSTEIFSTWTKASTAIGCHHVCFFEEAEGSDQQLVVCQLSVFNEQNKLDRSWSVFKDILQMVLSKSPFIPFENNHLTRILKSSILDHMQSTVLLLHDDVEIVEMAELLQHVFQIGIEDSGDVESSENTRHSASPGEPTEHDDSIHFQQMNALKNEIFVMEDDMQVYEDEIGRLHRTIEEKNNQILQLQYKLELAMNR